MRNPVSLVLAVLVLVMFTVVTSRKYRDFDDTCESFTKAIEEAEDTMDQTKTQAYIEMAERIYAALNNVVVEAGLPALSISQDPKSRNTRLGIVVAQCQKDKQLIYHDAVADAYLKLREAAGLPTQLLGAHQ